MNKMYDLSPAKINLTLDVMPKQQEENFHRLRTIYHQISLADEMEIQAATHFEIQGNFDCPWEQNLIFRAFEWIRNYFPKKKLPPVQVKVNKKIPAQGGLGGGSSNFVTFIKLYFRLFELGQIPDILIQKSGHIGKDIPLFFFTEKCVLGNHFGEVITPLNFSFYGQKAYLYIPPFRNATGAMFHELQNFQTNYTQKFLDKPNLQHCGNAFDIFLDKNPYAALIPTDKRSLFHLSGTGSCFFAFEKIDVPQCDIYEITFQ